MRETLGFIDVQGRKVHYRHTGHGPPMILMHASPLTAKSLAAVASQFGEHFSCFALDNPGFGLSDPITEGSEDIFTYADALKETINALGLDQPIIYGASTGGVITHAFGCKYPDEARLLMLDTLSHMDTEDYLGGYFPDVRPTSGGTHFLTIWEKIIGLFLFSPWQKGDAHRRQQRALPPPQALHDMVMQLFEAGPEYRHLYKVAIAWEDAANVNKLNKAPVTLNLWQAASSLARTQELIDAGLPDNYIIVPSASGRYDGQLAYLLEHGYDRQQSAVLDRTPGRQPGTYNSQYGNSRYGQIYVKANHEQQPHGLLLLHDWGSSSLYFDALAAQLEGGAVIVTPDLLGHGFTPSCADGADSFRANLNMLCDLLDDLGIVTVDVLGVGGGAVLGAALKQCRPDSVRSANGLGTAPIVGINETDALKKAWPNFTPQYSMAHILNAFQVAKHARVFWQWWQPNSDEVLARNHALDAQQLHQATVDLLRAGEHTLQGQVDTATKVLELFASDSIRWLIPDWHVASKPLLDRVTNVPGQALILPSNDQKWGEVILKELNRISHK